MSDTPALHTDISSLNVMETILARNSLVGLRIQTHYGDHVLRVSEIWVQDGALVISVFNPPETK